MSQIVGKLRGSSSGTEGNFYPAHVQTSSHQLFGLYEMLYNFTLGEPTTWGHRKPGRGAGGGAQLVGGDVEAALQLRVRRILRQVARGAESCSQGSDHPLSAAGAQQDCEKEMRRSCR